MTLKAELTKNLLDPDAIIKAAKEETEEMVVSKNREDQNELDAKVAAINEETDTVKKAEAAKEMLDGLDFSEIDKIASMEGSDVMSIVKSAMIKDKIDGVVPAKFEHGKLASYVDGLDKEGSEKLATYAGFALKHLLPVATAGTMGAVLGIKNTNAAAAKEMDKVQKDINDFVAEDAKRDMRRNQAIASKFYNLGKAAPADSSAIVADSGGA